MRCGEKLDSVSKLLMTKKQLNCSNDALNIAVSLFLQEEKGYIAHVVEDFSVPIMP